MRTYKFAGQTYDKVIIASTPLDELTLLSSNLQSAIQAVANKKRRLTRKGNPSKDYKLADNQLAELVQLSNIVSYYKKKARDTMQKERDWYKKFFDECMRTGGRKAKDIIATTDKLMGYSL